MFSISPLISCHDVSFRPIKVKRTSALLPSRRNILLFINILRYGTVSAVTHKFNVAFYGNVSVCVKKIVSHNLLLAIQM